MNAQGNIYFTEGKVPEEDRERLEAAMRDDAAAIAKRIEEMQTAFRLEVAEHEASQRA